MASSPLKFVPYSAKKRSRFSDAFITSPSKRKRIVLDPEFVLPDSSRDGVEDKQQQHDPFDIVPSSSREGSETPEADTNMTLDDNPGDHPKLEEDEELSFPNIHAMDRGQLKELLTSAQKQIEIGPVGRGIRIKHIVQSVRYRFPRVVKNTIEASVEEILPTLNPNNSAREDVEIITDKILDMQEMSKNQWMERAMKRPCAVLDENAATDLYHLYREKLSSYVDRIRRNKRTSEGALEDLNTFPDTAFQSPILDPSDREKTLLPDIPLLDAEETTEAPESFDEVKTQFKLIQEQFERCNEQKKEKQQWEESGRKLHIERENLSGDKIRNKMELSRIENENRRIGAEIEKIIERARVLESEKLALQQDKQRVDSFAQEVEARERTYEESVKTWEEDSEIWQRKEEEWKRIETEMLRWKSVYQKRAAEKMEENNKLVEEVKREETEAFRKAEDWEKQFAEAMKTIENLRREKEEALRKAENSRLRREELEREATDLLRELPEFQEQEN